MMVCGYSDLGRILRERGASPTDARRQDGLERGLDAQGEGGIEPAVSVPARTLKLSAALSVPRLVTVARTMVGRAGRFTAPPSAGAVSVSVDEWLGRPCRK